MKPVTLQKVTLLHGCFTRFLNCTNGTKSRKAPQIFCEDLDTYLRGVLLKDWFIVEYTPSEG